MLWGSMNRITNVLLGGNFFLNGSNFKFTNLMSSLKAHVYFAYFKVSGPPDGLNHPPPRPLTHTHTHHTHSLSPTAYTVEIFLPHTPLLLYSHAGAT